MKKKRIAIIGGGCSGLFLANLLDNELVEIFLIEKNNKLGKKILASGNGKCNFSNVGDLKDKYNNNFAHTIIDKFSVDKTLNEFSKMGLVYKADDMGRCYPVSECSSSVLDCLKKGLEKVRILLDSEVKNISCIGKEYVVTIGNEEMFFDYVVCCSGSLASNLGSSKAYSYLNNMGLKMVEISPSLVPVLVKEKIASLKGVRVKCLVKLIDQFSNVVYSEFGEVMFKENALSGIAVFNISSYINRKEGNYKISLDLSAGMSEKELVAYLENKGDNVNSLFKGFLNDKIGEYIISKYNFKDGNISKENLNLLVKDISDLSFNVKGLYPFIDGQVCSGGVSISNVNQFLELKQYPNIYIAGELLDVDGICGGYNMQFAWSCAGVIADDINRKIGEKSGK